MATSPGTEYPSPYTRTFICAQHFPGFERADSILCVHNNCCLTADYASTANNDNLIDPLEATVDYASTATESLIYL